MKTYNIENEHNVTTTVVKIDNDLDTDDAMALVSFFVFMFALILLGLLIYYGSSLKLWWRQSVVFPIRRLCCEKERKRLWRLHKDAVIRADRALAGARESDPSLLEEAPSSEDPLERALDSLVGLEPLKEEIRALRRTLVVEQQRRNVLNLGGDGKKRKAARVSAPHMVFRGSPGTGKTHAARLISQLLKELGYVHGDIVEVQRADLVAGYVGQTALKTRAVINRAKGGVLFVDEAYALTPGTSAAAGRDFGAEAVQELMRDLTSGDPVVILAGYPREMERFLNVNPGLSRRFQVRFTFADYSIQQLAAIFVKIRAAQESEIPNFKGSSLGRFPLVKIADRNGFRLGRDCSAAHLEHVLSTHFPESLCRKWNGGLPEGLFRRAQDALAKRLNVLTMSAEAALTLTSADVSLGADGLPFDKLKNVPARLDRLERSLNGLILANQAQVNPWAAPAPAP
ncbi:ATP binding protein [Aureococcus anophagefferens]|nr:ATP binding protein [Aureococcus anophagefferens]